ncbi:hypothetical protein BKA66DRAFT_573067 [Pyrenochaeta sp. MPI-SDFR-AT-0127]|nr:hypothetical protein BKA66DRAFT_573067 [Pyrenochaeta sp. MPI-SDFR-AT-0127]
MTSPSQSNEANVGATNLAENQAGAGSDACDTLASEDIGLSGYAFCAPQGYDFATFCVSPTTAQVGLDELGDLASIPNGDATTGGLNPLFDHVAFPAQPSFASYTPQTDYIIGGINGFGFAPQHDNPFDGSLDWSSNQFTQTGYAGIEFPPPPVSHPPSVPTPTAFCPIAPATPGWNATQAGNGIHARQTVAEPRIPCPYTDCTTTFRRPGEFRRHMKKHQPHTYKCILVDCNMTFYRLDKVRDHLLKRHSIKIVSIPQSTRAA